MLVGTSNGPPSIIAQQCKHMHLFVGLMQGLTCSFAPKISFDDAFNFLASVFSVALFQLVCDSVSAHLKLAIIFQAFAKLDPAMRGCVALVWFEQCYLHPLSRVSGMLLSRHNLRSPVYQISRLFNKSKAKAKLVKP